MTFVLLILVLLIFAIPITIIFEGIIAQALVAVVAAMLLVIVAVRIRPGEAGFLSTVVRPVAVVAIIPAIWMLIQIVPLQSSWIVHPIWKSAAAALGQPFAGSISIDPGATLISLVRYCSAMAIAFVAAAVAADRLRAEWVLFALTAESAFVALLALAKNFGLFTFLGDGGQSAATATAVACLGRILAVAAALHTLERHGARRPGQANSNGLLTFLASLSVFLISLFVVVAGATGQALFSVICGMATLAIAVVIRRLDLGPWGIAAVISMTFFIAAAVVLLSSGNRTLDLTIAFASQAPASLSTVTQHMLTETGWAGSGAGTFGAALPIYQDVDVLKIGQIAPTAAASIIIDMGRPFFIGALIATVALIIALFRGALRRQRDSSYSMAGAACVVTIMLLSFGSPALLTTPMLIVVAVVIGVAVAQSKSRLV